MKFNQSIITFPGRNEVAWNKKEGSLSSDRVLLEAQLSGISAGTEGMWFDGSASALKTGRKSYPYTPGYEFVGVVTAIGGAICDNPKNFPRLSSLAVGDRVFAFKPHASHNQITESDMWVKLPDNVSNDDALVLALATTAIHAIHRGAPAVGGTAAVFGLGTLGLALIQILKASGASRIMAVTGSPEKAELAKYFGATDLALLKEIRNQKSKIELFDTVYDCSGSVDVLNTALSACANQGTIVAAGFYNDPICLDGELMFSRELTLKSVRATGAVEPRSDHLRWPRAENFGYVAELLFANKIYGRKLISHRIEPSDMEDAYEMISNRDEQYLQVAVDWSGDLT